MYSSVKKEWVWRSGCSHMTIMANRRNPSIRKQYVHFVRLKVLSTHANLWCYVSTHLVTIYHTCPEGEDWWNCHAYVV